MTFPFLNLPERVIIRVVQIAVSSIHRRRLIRIQVFRVWKDQTLINYIDKKWRKDYPNSYEDGNRHRSILSRAKWLCLYGVLYDAALNCLVGTFGRHGISEDEIRGMVGDNYNANRENFGVSRMDLYGKGNQGIAYRNQKLRENTPFNQMKSTVFSPR